MIDERKGQTSASNAEADLLCPGRHLAQKGLPDIETKYAKTGTAIHEAAEGKAVDIDADSQDCVDRAKEIESRILAEWLNGATNVAEYREKRLWYHDAETLTPRHSGKLDVYWISGSRALISDLKSLYGDVTEAPSNLQLRDQSVLLWLDGFGDIKEITVYINQPNVTTKPGLCVYDEESIKQAFLEMVKRVERSNSLGSKRIPGKKQCQWCRAWATCPEAQAKGTEAMLVLKDEVKLVTLTHAQQVELYDACEWVAAKAKQYTDSIKEKVKATPLDWPEFKIETSRGNREITNIKGVVKACSDVLTNDDIIGAATFPITKIELAFATNYSRVKGGTKKAAEEEFFKRAGNFIGRKADKQTIVRNQPALAEK